MSYLLSIIIPTKDRYSTLLPVIESMYCLNKELVEIIIHDNSLNPSVINEFLSNKTDCSNIRYFHSTDKLSQTENSNLAVLNSTGEYVCFIGDDDGVMPYINDVVLWMKRTNIQVLKASKPSYYWPNQQSSYTSKDVSGILRNKKYSYSAKLIPSSKALKYTLQKGGSSMEMLPSLYHGIVKREVLDAIYAKCNTFFPGPSPDMANAIALITETENYTYVDFPIVVSGKSSHSIGGTGVLHKHVSRIEDVAHLSETISSEWSAEIPKYWTAPTIWAESVLKSLNSMGESQYIKQFRFSYLYASLFVFNYSHRKNIFNDFNTKYKTVNYYYDVVIIVCKRVKVFIKNRLPWRQSLQINNIKDIKAAIKIINIGIDENLMPF